MSAKIDADNKTPRPNCYVMLDFAEPIAGVSDNVFETVLTKRVNEVLALSGRIAAQLFRFATPPPSARPTSLAFTKYLVIWETEGNHAQELQNALIAAKKAGEVAVLLPILRPRNQVGGCRLRPSSPRTISNDKV